MDDTDAYHVTQLVARYWTSPSRELTGPPGSSCAVESASTMSYRRKVQRSVVIPTRTCTLKQRITGEKNIYNVIAMRIR